MFNKGRFFGGLVLVLVAALSPVSGFGMTSWVEVVARNAGVADTNWRSELTMVNSLCNASEPTAISLSFFPGDGSGARNLSIYLEAGESRIFRDVLQELFQIDEGAGPLKIVVPDGAEIMLGSRTYNDQGTNGTFGQMIPAVVGPRDGLAPGAEAFLPHLRQDTSFRTNIDLLNTSNGSLVWKLSLYDGQTMLGEKQGTLASGRRIQHSLSFFVDGGLIEDIGKGWAKLELLNGSGLWALASVVDQISGDPTTIPMEVLAADPPSVYWIQQIASLPGSGGSDWHSSVAILNPGGSDAPVHLGFVSGEQEEQGEITILSGDQWVVDDILDEVFGLSETRGALRIESEFPLVISSRTYSRTEDGMSFGQSIGALTEGEAVKAGTEIVLQGLRENDGFRTNLFFFSPGADAEISVDLYSGLEPFDTPCGRRNIQLNENSGFAEELLHAFETACPGVNVDEGWARVRVTSGGPVAVLGSVVDNISNDPSSVQPLPTQPAVGFSWSPENPAVHETIVFTGSSPGVGGDQFWKWMIENDVVAETQQFEWQFETPGEYEVALEASADGVNWGHTVASVEVRDSIEIVFFWSPYVPVLDENVFFSASSPDVDADQYWRWTIDGEAVAEAPEFNWQFRTTGNHDVVVEASTDGVRWGSATDAVEVKPFLAAFTYGPFNPELGKDLYFYNRTYGAPDYLKWEFGDGEILQGEIGEAGIQRPVHNYGASEGPFLVRLTAYLGGLEGESDSYEEWIAFVPTVDFSWTPDPGVLAGEEGASLEFTDHSTLNPGQWKWDFGNGSDLEFRRNPLEVYEEANVYSVSLWALNDAGGGWGMKRVEIRGDCSPPEVPVLESLDGDGAGLGSAYYLRWDSTSPTESYEFWENTDSSFPEGSGTRSLVATTESPRLLHETEGRYYYKVRARERASCSSAAAWSAWSDAVSVDVGADRPVQVREFSVVDPSTGENIKFEMLRVPAGIFDMGSPDDPAEPGRLADEDLHRVEISQDFYMGRFEVTQELWKAVTGTTPWLFKDCGDDCPVEGVSWGDICGSGTSCGSVSGFVYRLNSLLGLSGETNRFRLPTEAEWEMAARAGTTTRFSYGDVLPSVAGNRDDQCGGSPIHDDHMQWCQNAIGGVQPVGGKDPNPLGLYDMNGSVREWVWDRYGSYITDGENPVIDPTGPVNGNYRCARGGSWADWASFSRSATRFAQGTNFYASNWGFRLVFGPEPSAGSKAGGRNPQPYVGSRPPHEGITTGPELPTLLQRRIDLWKVRRELNK